MKKRNQHPNKESSQNWIKLTDKSRNDLVFQKRNKSYGAYVIRNDYERHLQTVLMRMLFISLVASGLFFVIGQTIKIEPDITIPDIGPDLVDPWIDEDPPKGDDKPPARATTGPASNTTPEVTDQDQPVDSTTEALPVIPEAGVPGPAGNDSAGKDIASTGGAGKKQDAEDIDSVIFLPEIMPRFPGGDPALGAYIRNNVSIPPHLREIGSLKVKIGVVFIVSKDGTVSDPQLISGGSRFKELNDQALNAVRKMPKWEPGMQNGKAVKVRLVQPFSFVVNR